MYIGLIAFFLLAIIVSFLCSLWESVLLSITPSWSQLQQDEGGKLGRQLTVFKQNVDRPLAAILTLNTIAHTVGAIGVGEQATSIWHDSHPLITAFIVPVIMTLGILLLSEIIPKTLGANYWKELAKPTISALSVLIVILMPAVWLSERITRSLRKDKEGSIFSRPEFLAMAELGVKQGVIQKSESQSIKSMLNFGSLQVKDVMTPRVVVNSLSEDLCVKEFLSIHKKMIFSRIPVYELDKPEKISGYVRRDEVLIKLLEGPADITLGDFKRELIVVLQNHAIPQLLELFLNQREHIALVVDEFGGMCGIVTMEDIIETMLGMEIMDEMDKVEDMQKHARELWEKRASLLGLSIPERREEK